MTSQLAPEQNAPEQDRGHDFAGHRRGFAEGCLEPVLGQDDNLEDALQQRGSQQGKGEGLAEHLREVLDEEVQDDHVHEHVDDRGSDTRPQGRRDPVVRIRHRNLADHVGLSPARTWPPSRNANRLANLPGVAAVNSYVTDQTLSSESA
jgi:hypothetical protein